MKKWRWGWLVLVLIQVLAGCSAMGKTIRSLPPEDQQFLSEVRYIITKQEKKVFPSLGAAERKQFIEDFWKKRDPSPDTEENEFRDEYYGRIDKANRLFREGSSGWLTDRGRAYILLGDPERRNTYPSGYTFYDRPMEIWYYQYFTIVFVDYTFTGVYKLEPQSVQQLGVIASTQMRLKPEGLDFKQVVFDFDVRVETSAAGEATLIISVPYEKLSMTQKPGQTSAIETVLKIDVLVSGPKDETVLQKQETHTVSLSPGDLDKLSKKLGIQLSLQLAPGNYSALVTLENATDNSKVSKKINFSL
ncbi:MAG: GWxTD domain-containing protein [Candidatus Aminicenantes bacterium]|nr:GWxTD domain-containing protein [Candidatus Aminicenantes bacterium]